MSTINVTNVVPFTFAGGDTIPMFVLPQGYVRFRTGKLNDGSFSFIICLSDTKVDITKEISHSEAWENQKTRNVFAIRFESVEQIEAFIKAFNTCLNRTKTTE